MAEQIIELGEGIEPIRLAPEMLPVATVLARLARIDRKRLEWFLETGIEILDLFDGDPDREDATDLEDDFQLSPIGLGFNDGPGCIVSDQDAGAWIEWTCLAPAKKRGPNDMAGPEDAEEDDASGQCDEDGINTAQGWIHNDGPGCRISDEGIADTGGFHD